MYRVTPLPPTALTPEQRRAYDCARSFLDQTPVDRSVWEDRDGVLTGPFLPMMHTPTVIEPFSTLLIEMSKLPGFSRAAREVAILAVGSHFQAHYVLYAHGECAAHTGLTPAQIEAVKTGRKPGGEEVALDAECEVAFDVATELVKKPGPLADESWRRAETTFGKEGALALTYYAGFYAFICTLLNAVDIPVATTKEHR